MSEMNMSGGYTPKGIGNKEKLLDLINNQYEIDGAEIYKIAKKEWDKWEDWRISNAWITCYSCPKEAVEEKMNYIQNCYKEGGRLFEGNDFFVMMDTKKHNRAHIYIVEK